jgi:hypothetical protein
MAPKTFSLCSLLAITLWSAHIVTQPAPRSPEKTAIDTRAHKKSDITITNTIQNQDLGYYKMFSWHYPKDFFVNVNGRPLESGQSITLDTDRIEVTFSYRWQYLGITRTGNKQTLYRAVPEKNHYTIVFNGWEKPQKISIPQARLITHESPYASKK